MTEENEIRSVADLLDACDALNKRFAARVWWRGQSALAEPGSQGARPWNLVPGAFRVAGPKSSYEQNLLYLFTLRAPPRHPKCPDDDELASWMFLAQHFRLPTRLLDWTESPLLGAYFAVVEHPSEVARLYALNPYVLNEHQLGQRGILLPSHESVAAQTAEAFGHQTQLTITVPTDRVLAVLPKEVDARMMVQQSGFTLHGVSTPIDELPAHEEYLVSYRIPAAAKSVIVRDLQLLSVRPSNVFPDLENLAELRHLEFEGQAVRATQEFGNFATYHVPGSSPSRFGAISSTGAEQ